MRLVFFGSDAFAVPSLERVVAAGHEVALVITNPDRPKGRSGAPQPTPVKEAALRLGLEVLQPEGKLGDEAAGKIAASGAELGVVVAFGQFLTKRVREAPSRGFSINVHGSLLPRWRGAAPDFGAVLAGDAETGVSIQKVEKTLDGGDVLLRATTPIGADEGRGALRERLGLLGADLLVQALEQIAAGTARFEPQDAALVTHQGIVKKEDGRLDLSRPAVELERRVRACDPWPAATLELPSGPLQVLSARATEVEQEGAPGAVLEVAPGTVLEVQPGEGAVVVATGPPGSGALHLAQVKPAGKRAMAGAAWARGRRLGPGDRLA
jgi:methionyl-tRNA formyltransferase